MGYFLVLCLKRKKNIFLDLEKNTFRNSELVGSSTQRYQSICSSECVLCLCVCVSQLMPPLPLLHAIRFLFTHDSSRGEKEEEG